MKLKNSLQLQDFLPYRLSVASNRISRLIAGAYQEAFGIGIPEWRTIAVLGETPGLTSTQIAVRTAMDRVAVSRAVSTLVKKGYVKRFASDSDGRLSHLRLTQQGLDVYGEVVPVALGYEEEVLAGLTESDRQQLSELLTKLQRRLDEIDQQKGESPHDSR